ncbi:exodeoxyribonuclease VII large subunit [Streptomyces griseus]
MALTTSPEAPLPVGDVSRLIGGWIDRLGAVWVEGQITQLSRRPGAGVVFLTLRDPSHDISVSVTCFRQVFDRIADVVTEGARVVVLAKPEWYAPRGQLSLRATEIRPVGIGELLVRLEQLKKSLAAEGLFALDRKKPLPFLPQLIGLVSGRASAAERDVLENARRRWPAVRFEVRNTAVQGVHAVNQVVQAVHELDGLPEVDVIVVARGGGSVEDLLPFSDEALIRAVAACRTPVVSAIGHEPDSPLLDLVADVRASTPTDAAKKVVPDVGEELDRVQQLRDRALRTVRGLIDREERGLAHALGRSLDGAPAADGGRARGGGGRAGRTEPQGARTPAGPRRLGARAHPGPGGGAVAGGDAGAGVRRPPAAGRPCGPLPRGRRGAGRGAEGAGLRGRVHRTGRGVRSRRCRSPRIGWSA